MSIEQDEKYREDLKNEITRLIKELNQTRDMVEKEKKILFEDLAKTAENHLLKVGEIEKSSSEKSHNISSQVIKDLYEEAENKIKSSNEIKIHSELKIAEAEKMITNAKLLKLESRSEKEEAIKIRIENKQKEIELNNREKSIESCESLLRKEVAKFTEYSLSEQKRIDGSMTDISLARNSIIIMRKELDQRKKDDLNEIFLERVKLKEERALLDSAWRELKAKK